MKLSRSAQRRTQVALIAAMAAGQHLQLGRHRGGIEEFGFTPELLVGSQHGVAGIAEAERRVTGDKACRQCALASRLWTAGRR